MIKSSSVCFPFVFGSQLTLLSCLYTFPNKWIGMRMERGMEGYLGSVWIIGEQVSAAENVATIVCHISCLSVSLLDIRYHSGEICTKKNLQNQWSSWCSQGGVEKKRKEKQEHYSSEPNNGKCATRRLLPFPRCLLFRSAKHSCRVNQVDNKQSETWENFCLSPLIGFWQLKKPEKYKRSISNNNNSIKYKPYYKITSCEFRYMYHSHLILS